jgi:CheY-like chemotaxis protein
MAADAAHGGSTSSIMETTTQPTCGVRPAPAPAPDTGQSTATAAATKTILLLDGAKLFLRFEETILQRRDWRLLSANSAAEALAVLEGDTPELVVMDHLLPDMKGADFVRRIRATPGLSQTPILLLSARGSETAVADCMSAGANAFLFKPVLRQTLCALVEELIHVQARRHVRTLVRLQVDARHDASFFLGQSVNLSAGGMLVETSRELACDQEIDLRFQVPACHEPFVTRARVVRCERMERGGWSTGLEFVAMSDAQRAIIDAFVRQARSEMGIGTRESLS